MKYKLICNYEFNELSKLSFESNIKFAARFFHHILSCLTGTPQPAELKTQLVDWMSSDMQHYFFL